MELKKHKYHINCTELGWYLAHSGPEVPLMYGSLQPSLVPLVTLSTDPTVWARGGSPPLPSHIGSSGLQGQTLISLLVAGFLGFF